MKNAVLDPAILFISETNWFDIHKRDNFLKHLFNNLTSIDQYSVAKILWNDELENCLWSYPPIPPWRQDKDWGNQIVPAIYHLLRKNVQICSCGLSQTTCNVQPAMNCCNPNALLCFMKLMHRLISLSQHILLCLGLANVLPTHEDYVFNCACCSQSLVPELINSPTDWLHHVDIENDYWPNSITEENKIFKALDIIRIRDFNGSPFLHKFCFVPKFISELSLTQSNRTRILKQMVKKLIFTRQQATSDTTLQDEYLRDKREYRFRVTKSIRIHYHHGADGQIYFLSFYDVGQHDEGLR